MERIRTLDPPAAIEAHVLDGGRAVVSLSGVVDMKARRALEDAFSLAIAPELRELVVDLSRATLVDSVALGTLVYAGKRVMADGGRIVFTGANQEVGRVFELTGLNRVFRVERAAAPQAV